MCLRFPVAKLTDYAERWPELEQSDNPFASAVMAHLKARETLHDATERRRWKFILVRRLYEKGYDRGKIRNDNRKLTTCANRILTTPSGERERVMGASPS